MTWWLAGIVANVCIMAVEYFNRAGGFGSFAATLPYTLVPIVVSQWALYYSWVNAPTMLMAWIWFAAGNAALRLIVTGLMLREPLNWRHVVLVGMMFSCSYAMKLVK